MTCVDSTQSLLFLAELYLLSQLEIALPETHPKNGSQPSVDRNLRALLLFQTPLFTLVGLLWTTAGGDDLNFSVNESNVKPEFKAGVLNLSNAATL